MTDSTTRQQRISAMLADLSRALRHLHKALLDVEAENFRDIAGPLQLLDLAANHPQFAWLRQLSELMADIDERREDLESLTSNDVAAIKKTLQGLVGPDEPPAPKFRERYLAAMQQSPAVAMAHAEVRQALKGA